MARMDVTPIEWVNLILRWTHVIAAIFWIGHAFLFNELEEQLVPPEPDDPREGLEGELWMVHGGGFYYMQKTWSYPERLRGALKWFKWEAAFTWLSGFSLLVVVFYLGGGVYLVDRSVADIGVGTAAAVGVASLVVGWLVYDGLCRTPLVENGPLFALVGWLGVLGVAFGLTHLLSARAAFLHVGALLATLMVANVWLVIIPISKKMVAAARGGELLDAKLGRKAKLRSRHNNYIVFPVIFLMISNHYPTIYGARNAWVLLGGMVLLGAGIKHMMNRRGEIHGIYWATAVALFGALGLWGWSTRSHGETVAAGPATGLRPIDPATTGSVRGTVRFEGTVPPPRAVDLVNCPQQSQGPAEIQTVRVSDGDLADAFVWVQQGWEGWQVPPPPTDSVEVDQRGCRYHPHVIGVRVGQPVEFVNADPVPHNVHAQTVANPGFNEMMVGQDTRLRKVFGHAEVMVHTKCDIHPWMSEYIGVVPHPWFQVTGKDGAFSLDGLPPGVYDVAAWHEGYALQHQQVQVTTGQAAKLVFTFGD